MFLNILLQGGQRTSHIRVFSIENFIMAKFFQPTDTSPLIGVNPAGTPGYRNGTESFFGLKGRPSVVRDVEIHNQPVLRMRRK